MTTSRCVLTCLLSLCIAHPTSVRAQEPATRTPRMPSPDDVVATVGGRVIRMRDLEQRWCEQDLSSFTQVLQQVHAGSRRALDALIDEALLDAEAQKRGLTVDRLLEAELPKWMPEPTEAEILDVYTRSGLVGKGLSLENLRDNIIDALKKRPRPPEAMRPYLSSLRKAAPDLKVSLDPPRQSVPVLPTDRVMGPATARVEIIEYGDFQCPMCKLAFPVLKQLLSQYKDQVRFVWKDYPLPNHLDARPAAAAARCLTDAAMFWRYHDKLFGSQQALGKARLKDYAKQMGADPAAFGACFDKSVHRDQVQANIDEGDRYGVAGTPTIFINGRLVAGAMPYDVYDRIVREELAAPPADGPR